MQTKDVVELQKSGVTLDSQFVPSFRSSKAQKPCAIGAKKDAQIKETDTKIWTGDRVVGCVPCEECGKKRVVYARRTVISETNTERQVMQAIDKFCDHTPYLCGFPLINDKKHPLYYGAFVCEHLHCRMSIQNHYYSELVKKKMLLLLCPFCGTVDNLEENPPQVEEKKQEYCVRVVSSG